MKYRILEILVCPKCKNNLQLFPFKVTINDLGKIKNKIQSPRCNSYCMLHNIPLDERNSTLKRKNITCAFCYEKEIEEGLLKCNCGLLFPVIDSVPILMEDGIKAHFYFYSKYKEKIDPIINSNKKKMDSDFSTSIEYKSIHHSFSEEWDYFDYDNDKTWGWDINERKQIFLNDIAKTSTQVKGKLLLDAGCGNGVLTSALSDFGMEVVGLDISESVRKANNMKEKFAKENSCYVHFIQGNLYNPPLKNDSFNLIYSSGVLHHTPDTKKTFSKIVPLCKKDGRMYIWVYGKRNFLVWLFFFHGRTLRKFISLKALFNYCKIISPLYKVLTDLFSFLRIAKFRRRTSREIALDLFDIFSPPWNHAHEKEEVLEWFVEMGFKGNTVSGIQKHGFGVYGDKK